MSIAAAMLNHRSTGVLHQIRPIKLFGYGLDEQGFCAVKRWTYKPATRLGEEFAVIVPIDLFVVSDELRKD